MKKALLLPLLALAFYGCEKIQLDSLTEGLYFNVNANNYLKNQMFVQVINANYQSGINQPNALVSITGTDAGEVYDINGGRSIKINDQIALLAISPGKNINPAAPLSFTIEAKAPGFLPVSKQISYNSTDSFKNVVLEMIEISNPPKGVEIESTSVDLASLGNKTIGISSTGLRSNLFIPENLIAKTTDGKQVSGISQIEINQIDALEPRLSANANDYIPKNSNKVIKNGISEESVIEPLGYFNFNVKQNEKSIGSFDKPMILDIEIPSQTIDKISGKPYENGDVLQLIRKNPQDESWIHVADVKIKATSSSSLKASLNLDQPGIYSLSKVVTAAAISRVRVSVQFNRSSNVNTLHYIEIYNVNNPSVPVGFQENVEVVNKGRFNFNIPGTTADLFIIKVWEYETQSDPKNRVLVTTGQINPGLYPIQSPFQITINPQTVTGNAVARFELDTYCQQSKLVYYHTGRTMYRVLRDGAQRGAVPEDNVFRDLGLAQRSGRIEGEIVSNLPTNTTSFSFMESDRLKWALKYEFKTVITGRSRVTNQLETRVYTRSKWFIQYEYNNTTSIPRGLPQDFPGGYWRYKDTYWYAPDNSCADFGY